VNPNGNSGNLKMPEKLADAQYRVTNNVPTKLNRKMGSDVPGPSWNKGNENENGIPAE